jgi:hypothetical protein
LRPSGHNTAKIAAPVMSAKSSQSMLATCHVIDCGVTSRPMAARNHHDRTRLI